MDEKVVDDRLWVDGVGDDEDICDRCRGLGLVFLRPEEDEFAREFGNNSRSFSVCPKCKGNGKVDWVTAAMNHGTFYNPFKEKKDD